MADTKYNSVMLIDDNEIDNLINQKIIESSNICNHIFTHTGGKAAIEFLKNVEKIALTTKNNNVMPDIIFLDIDMPLMDGFQFLDEFENLSSNIRQHCKIVMLTSSINSKDVQKSKRYSNVKQYINKPLSKDSLKSLSI